MSHADKAATQHNVRYVKWPAVSPRVSVLFAALHFNSHLPPPLGLREAEGPVRASSWSAVGSGRNLVGRLALDRASLVVSASMPWRRSSAKRIVVNRGNRLRTFGERRTIGDRTSTRAPSSMSRFAANSALVSDTKLAGIDVPVAQPMARRRGRRRAG